jgi:hypothetical protein
LPGAVELDDLDQIPLLKEIAAREDLTATMAWLDEFF